MAAKRLVELLAVEPTLKTQAEQLRKDLGAAFEKKHHLYAGKRITFTSTEEGKSSEPVEEEQSDIQSNVMDELRWIAGHWAKAIDVSYRVAEGNMAARADVILDDGTTVLISQAPATALLELEKRTTEIIDLLKRVPTLDPARGFKLDPTSGKNIYRARDVDKTRTRKDQVPIILAPATERHQAQVNLVSSDVEIGRIKEQVWSSMVTPAQKSELLTRAEEVRRAIKAALHRANTTMLVMEPECAKAIFDYVIGPDATAVATA